MRSLLKAKGKVSECLRGSREVKVWKFEEIASWRQDRNCLGESNTFDGHEFAVGPIFAVTNAPPHCCRREQSRQRVYPGEAFARHDQKIKGIGL